MNKTIYYIFAFATMAFLLSGCDQKIDYPYKGKDKVQFKCYTTSSTKVRNYYSSQTYSFGLLPEEVETGVAKIVVEYMGHPSDVDRTYYVSILPDSTTAVEGVHYAAFSREQTIHAGLAQDTIEITIFREHMNTSFNDPVDARLHLVLEPSEDFDLGIEQGVRMNLLMNDYMTKPAWWDSHGGLYYYHPEKWKILISFNELYANSATCPFNQNNDGRTYTTGLSNYLNEIPTFDEETGVRLFLSTMQVVP